jgi:hypothetical protein
MATMMERSKMTKEERREDEVAKHMGRCVNYRWAGMGDDAKCEAGHRYVDMLRPLTADELERARASGGSSKQWGSFLRTPCVAENTDPVACPDRRFPTREEAEIAVTEREASTKRFLAGMSLARPAIVTHIKERGQWEQSVNGAIPCPVCVTGTLGYRYAGAYNGHIHARCSTEGCVSWME